MADTTDALSVHASVGPAMNGLADLLAGLQPEKGRNELATVVAGMMRDLPHEREGDRISTGISDLDARIGGLVTATFHVVIGRSGHGKSCLALTAALNAAKAGGRTLYVTREMNRRELAWRCLAAERNESWEYVRELARMDETVREECCRAAELPIVLEDRVSHIDQVRALVETAANTEKPYRLVVLDYMQIMRAEGTEEHAVLAKMAMDAKDMAMQNDCAVIGLVQPNRVNAHNPNHIPGCADIRGSSAIENAADSVTGLRKTDALLPGGSYGMTFHVWKARNASGGTLAGEYVLGAGTFLISQVKSEKDA